MKSHQQKPLVVFRAHGGATSILPAYSDYRGDKRPAPGGVSHPVPDLGWGIDKCKHKGKQKVSRSTRYKTHTRPLAFERDRKANARCWICNGEIDYTLPISSAPLAWEGDHVNAIANGGEELDLNNVRACHTQCNRARGKSNNTNGIGRRSRIW